LTKPSIELFSQYDSSSDKINKTSVYPNNCDDPFAFDDPNEISSDDASETCINSNENSDDDANVIYIDNNESAGEYDCKDVIFPITL